MLRKMDIETIKKRFSNEYVLLSDYEVDDFQHPLRGRVVLHSKDRDDIYNSLEKFAGGLCIMYTGEQELPVML